MLNPNPGQPAHGQFDPTRALKGALGNMDVRYGDNSQDWATSTYSMIELT